MNPNLSPSPPRFSSLVSFPDHQDVYRSRTVGSPKLSDHQLQFEALLSANWHLGVNFLTSFSGLHTCRYQSVSFSSISRSSPTFSCPGPQFSGLMAPGGQPQCTKAKFRPTHLYLRPGCVLDRARRSLHAIHAKEINFVLTSHFARCTLFGVYILRARL